MSAKRTELQYRLFELRDLEYQAFTAKLIPTIAPEDIIGVRTPELRRFARDYAQTPPSKDFLSALPHRYYEENMLHGFLIEQISDYSAAIKALESFLPYIDNWATCDLISPKNFIKHRPELYQKIIIWLDSDHLYTIRFAVGMLLRHFLDKDFRPEGLELAARIRSDEYYVNMMVAWYFATALAKQYDATLPFIIERRLSPWTHNKAIQKAVESRRIPSATKAFLRSLKIGR